VGSSGGGVDYVRKYKIHSERRKVMPENANGRYLTRILIGVLLTIVFAATGLIVADTRNGVSVAVQKIETLQEKKLDKERYYSDIGEIKQALKEINEKIDRLRK